MRRYQDPWDVGLAIIISLSIAGVVLFTMAVIMVLTSAPA